MFRVPLIQHKSHWARSWSNLTPKLGSNLGPNAAKLGTKPGTTTQNNAKRTNQIDFLSRLCNRQGKIKQVPHLVSLTRKTRGATNLLNLTVSGPKARVDSNYSLSRVICSTIFFN